MKKVLSILAIVLGAFLMASIATAAPVGATIQTGAASNYSEGNSVGNTSVSGGQVQEVNISGYSITNKWAGFYGMVSGSIVLGDSGGNKFYQWTVNDPTGSSIFAVVNGSTVDWGNISALYDTDSIMPSFLKTGSDSFNYTFTQQASSVTLGTLTLSNVNYTNTWQNGAQGTNFTTYALKDGTDKLMIYATKAEPATGFNGNTVDYQVLVGLTSDTQQVPVYFYMELA